MCDGRRIVTENNVTSIDISAEAFKDDQFILASQAQQVFYIEDPFCSLNWRVVQVVHHRRTWNMMGSNITEIDLLHNLNSSSLSLIIDLGNIENISLHLDDGEVDEIRASVISGASSDTTGDTSFINDDDVEDDTHEEYEDDETSSESNEDDNDDDEDQSYHNSESD
ncbi:DUF4216 domain-containing protein [Abeliophyllum distichum]|uniref:DUF4216 domain-containing protein n=1 Tax=Abeliophyllum distichum TaxID=126358 RepID=A0ABD1SC95_9LAMI